MILQVSYYIQTLLLHLSYGREHKWPFQILNLHKMPSYLPECIIIPQHTNRKPLEGNQGQRSVYSIVPFLNFKKKKNGKLFLKRCKTNIRQACK